MFQSFLTDHYAGEGLGGLDLAHRSLLIISVQSPRILPLHANPFRSDSNINIQLCCLYLLLELREAGILDRKRVSVLSKDLADCCIVSQQVQNRPGLQRVLQLQVLQSKVDILGVEQVLDFPVRLYRSFPQVLSVTWEQC